MTGRPATQDSDHTPGMKVQSAHWQDFCVEKRKISFPFADGKTSRGSAKMMDVARQTSVPTGAGLRTCTTCWVNSCQSRTFAPRPLPPPPQAHPLARGAMSARQTWTCAQFVCTDPGAWRLSCRTSFRSFATVRRPPHCASVTAASVC